MDIQRAPENPLSDAEAGDRPPPSPGPNVELAGWLARVLTGEELLAPVARALGMRLCSADEGVVVTEMDVDLRRHANPMGTLHGGILCDLADMAMGVAMATTLGPGESFTTLELKANYFKPVREGLITASARVLRRTRSIGYLECDVTDARGSLVARLGSTCMVLRGEAAAGR